MLKHQKTTRAAACLIVILALLLTCIAFVGMNLLTSNSGGAAANGADTVYLRIGTQTDTQEVILAHGGHETSVLTLTQGVDYHETAEVSLLDTFSDVMGMRGFILQQRWGTNVLRTYYTVVDGEAVEIAESFGDPYDDTVLDLDGDGITELICNVEYNADGGHTALVYRLMDGDIYNASTTELLDVPYDNWGVGAIWSYYDSARNVVVIHYALDGEKEYAVKEYLLELNRLTFTFVTSVAREDGTPVSEHAQRLAFGKVLWDIYQKGTLPNGLALDGYDMHHLEHTESSTFAIVDVDGDEQDELLLLWKTASMAGMTGRVFGYDGEAVYEELSAFPSLRFYDNGIVVEDASHNQNLAGDFWPYSVHQYDAQRGVYQRLGGVDAWDRRVREENAENSIWPTHFPTDIDVDGDGVVYWILPASWDGSYREAPMVDGPDYEDWRSAYLDGAQELSILFQRLTEENIAALGYPKPDVQYPQPVG